jgi:hypothetical protein
VIERRRPFPWENFKKVGEVGKDATIYKDKFPSIILYGPFLWNIRCGPRIRSLGPYGPFLWSVGCVGPSYVIYRVKAYNDVGDSPYSNEVRVWVGMEAPDAPSKLRGVPISYNEVTLMWEDNSHNEKGFEIERKVGGEEYRKIANVKRDIEIYRDKGLEPSTVYYYRIRAYNSGGHSLYSNEADVKTKPPFSKEVPPKAPSHLSAKRTSWREIELSWKDNSQNEVGFIIEVGGLWGGFFKEIATVDENVTRYRHKLPPIHIMGIHRLGFYNPFLLGTTFFSSRSIRPLVVPYGFAYRVKAYNEVGDSPYSNIAKVRFW